MPVETRGKTDKHLNCLLGKLLYFMFFSHLMKLPFFPITGELHRGNAEHTFWHRCLKALPYIQTRK